MRGIPVYTLYTAYPPILTKANAMLDVPYVETLERRKSKQNITVHQHIRAASPPPSPKHRTSTFVSNLKLRSDHKMLLSNTQFTVVYSHELIIVNSVVK